MPPQGAKPGQLPAESASRASLAESETRGEKGAPGSVKFTLGDALTMRIKAALSKIETSTCTGEAGPT